MPVPFLVPLLGSMAGNLAAGAGLFGAAGAAAGTGIGSLIASAAPSAIGAGTATLMAGGDPGEAITNALTAGIGSSAGSGITSMMGKAGAGAAGSAAGGAPTTAIRPVARPTVPGANAGAGIAQNAAAAGPQATDMMKLAQKIMGQGQQPMQVSPQVNKGQQEQRSSFGSIGAPAGMTAPMGSGMGGPPPMQQPAPTAPMGALNVPQAPRLAGRY